jgi:hypothetical protein
MAQLKKEYGNNLPVVFVEGRKQADERRARWKTKMFAVN